MYKILGLNCLITAFTLSALYLDGIKYGDTQMTLQGFLLAGCFLFLSWAKPVERLSAERPQPNIFNAYILTSVLAQFAIHSMSLWYVVRETKELLPSDWKVDLNAEDDLKPEQRKFEPNLLNTSVYLISLSMQVSTFMLNYQGRPFRESLRENRALFLSLSGLLCVALFGAAEIFPELNEWVELVPMPGRFSEKLVTVILLDLAACYVVETASSWLFANSRPKKSLDLEDESWNKLIH
jgi:cation-transporting ATPase 13A1